MSDTITISIIQFAPALCDRAETLRRLDPLLRQCTRADVIILPELCNSGYNFSCASDALKSAENIDSSPFLDQLSRKCAELNCEILAGFNELQNNDLYNSAVLLSARGVEGVYRKLHLFMNEKDYFEPGDLGLPVFEREYGTIGLQVCFDWAFYEGWRVLALKGAELIAHPSNLVIPGKAQRAIPIYAMTNRVFIATANRIGTEGELTFTGNSLIAAPTGEVVAEAQAAETCVLTAEIDLAVARDKTVTPRNDAFADRRPDQYTSLTEPQAGSV